MHSLKLISLALALFACSCVAPKKPNTYNKSEEKQIAAKPVVQNYKYDPSGPLPGHSNHGEAFNAGPRQAAYLIGGTGNVSFPITTSSPEAQKFFNQGVGQLHGFWYLEAERSFRQVLNFDPGNPMAYWGITMANANNRKRAKEIIGKAVANRDSVSERERMWIDATDASQKESSGKKRKAILLKAYQDISAKFPDDLEAKAFLALQMYRNVKAKKNYATIEKLIANILAKNPLHPCHHYRIHLWDYKDPKRAVPSIGQCGQASPSIAHMWHMPGHILSRLKRYHDATWQQEASARVDHANMMRDRVMPDEVHNFAHNNEWLTRNLDYAGRVHHAVTMAKNMIELPRLPRVKDDGTWTIATRSSHVYGRRHLHGLLANYELWDEILALKDTHYLRPGNSAADKAKHWRLVSSAHFNTGKINEGNTILDLMGKLLTKQRESKTKAGEAAADKARKDNKKESDVRKAKSAAERNYNTAITALERGIAEAKMHRAFQAGNKEEAKANFAKVGGFRNDRKAVIQLRLGNTAEAIKLAESAVKSGAEQARPLAAQAYILHAAGKPAEAKAAIEHLRRIAPQLDLDTECFARLAPLAKSLNLPADWRQAQPAAKDMGLRPDLDSLGPFRWEPSAAPSWTLPDRINKEFSLASLRGKPVLLIFYLGKGCLHCMEQLNKFDPVADRFSGQDISIFAVSSDTVTGLKDTFIGYADKDRHFSFPLLSDPSLGMFKAYRAYDDFEKTPLHGTFLIDGNGMVRWQNISYEPFMAPEFLLEEAKRLLSQP